jgi:hypothetical protein
MNTDGIHDGGVVDDFDWNVQLLRAKDQIGVRSSP